MKHGQRRKKEIFFPTYGHCVTVNGGDRASSQKKPRGGERGDNWNVDTAVASFVRSSVRGEKDTECWTYNFHRHYCGIERNPTAAFPTSHSQTKSGADFLKSEKSDGIPWRMDGRRTNRRETARGQKCPAAEDFPQEKAGKMHL